MVVADKNIKDQINSILSKAQALRGYTLQQITDYLNINTEASAINNTHIKGLTGQIVEFLLGASAGSKPLPDFPELGLEIKTLPINSNGEPKETTYVCMAQAIDSNNFEFKNSLVYKKLSLVLWLPIIITAAQNSNPTKPLENRTIGNAFLWQPNAKQIALLETDWLELTEMLSMGKIEQLSSHYGVVMQIRPKAANSKSLTSAIDNEGNITTTIPRGFYLRTNFTKEIYALNANGHDILP